MAILTEEEDSLKKYNEDMKGRQGDPDPPRKKRVTNQLEIQLFLHCGKCVEEGQRSDIEAGWTKFGIQVWCKVHQINIMNIDFEGAQHPADSTRDDSQLAFDMPVPEGPKH